jgi:hypothetical protein
MEEQSTIVEAQVEDVERNVQKPKADERVSFLTLFSTSEPLDVLFMVVGTISAIVTGVSIPFFNILFGRILDQLNGNTSSAQYQEKINTIVYAFVAVAGINLFTGYFQVPN